MNQIKLVVGGRNIIAEVSAFNNKQHVAIAPICEAIGIMTHGQNEKLKKSPQFSPTVICVPSAGGMQNSVCLPIEEVGMWLCNINANRVNPEIRDILIQFQKHCQVELHAAITGMAGTDRVAALEKQVTELVAQNKFITERMGQMMDFMISQQGTIDHLSKMVQPMANVEKHIASIGGKFMAVARGTKKMREELKH